MALPSERKSLCHALRNRGNLFRRLSMATSWNRADNGMLRDWLLPCI